jgi:hypothetical protein
VGALLSLGSEFLLILPAAYLWLAKRKICFGIMGLLTFNLLFGGIYVMASISGPVRHANLREILSFLSTFFSFGLLSPRSWTISALALSFFT